jgi:hypothetical protein
MTTRGTSTIESQSWEETPYAELDAAPKLTCATGQDLYHGDIEGEATFEYLMMYRPDGSASTVGLERVVGRLGERSGSFVLQLDGAFQGGEVKAGLSVVAGSATDELRGLQGEGTLQYRHGQSSLITLDYDFA